VSAYSVAVIPGDDSAPEAVRATLSVLEAMDLPISFDVLPEGATFAGMDRAEGEAVVRAAIDRSDTVLYGSTSGKTGGMTYLRWGRGTYANVRPIKWRPGVPSPLRRPEGIDYVIVRENIEDLYGGIEGDLATLLGSGLDTRPWGGRVEARYPPSAASEGRYAVKVITRECTARAAHWACQLARQRKAQGRPGRVTTAVKWNVLPRSDGYFREVARSVVAEYPDLEFEDYLTDDFARRLVADPYDLDVVLLPNLYGDILSDEGAATIGGLGVVPSGCYGEDFAYFEPVHGTAPDIVGQGIINPTATILTAVMLLQHLGLNAEAARLEAAVDAAIAAGDRLTPDVGGTARTEDFADAVRSRLGSAAGVPA
jgi:isocitrate/isopropylmalate dehydrogenase